MGNEFASPVNEPKIDQIENVESLCSWHGGDFLLMKEIRREHRLS